MGLPAGIYRVSLRIPSKCFRGPKLGDIRLTPSCELFVQSDVIAFLWAGDTVALLEEDTTQTGIMTHTSAASVQNDSIYFWLVYG